MYVDTPYAKIAECKSKAEQEETHMKYGQALGTRKRGWINTRENPAVKELEIRKLSH